VNWVRAWLTLTAKSADPNPGRYNWARSYRFPTAPLLQQQKPAPTMNPPASAGATQLPCRISTGASTSSYMLAIPACHQISTNGNTLAVLHLRAHSPRIISAALISG